MTTAPAVSSRYRPTSRPRRPNIRRLPAAGSLTAIRLTPILHPPFEEGELEQRQHERDEEEDDRHDRRPARVPGVDERRVDVVDEHVDVLVGRVLVADQDVD